ncbi:MAG: hypothetical protein Fur002_15210 [Anaerolineales bacterium]
MKKRLLSIALRVFVLFLFFLTLIGGQASARAGEPQLILTKSIDNDITNAKVGDTIFFRIRFACSSLTIDCGDVEIVDSLPTNPNPPNNPLFTYLPADSSVPAGFHLTESPAGTLTITKDDNMLLDGSQYDAVIAVRVNYETRPLPATVGNQVSGRIKPLGAPDWSAPITASAPNITIDAPVADWTLTKSLYSPSIEPTVDTDVTYRVSLCPNTTEGNVALTNITMTDTLPTNAAFISASNGGTEAGGVVTWSVAGPITPPACATRYVTMRFNTADGWAVGDPVTNTAAATGDYLDAGGAPCPNCVDSGSVPLGHNIIAIQDTPSYSKSDVGDPVGVDGTARFELHLSTNGTNYPANAVTLIDTLPAELQVKGVTSGSWADDHVRATIQYATNYNDPPNWTSFPGQPVQYNTNALYDSGLPANITKIQWVFEYDSDPNDLNNDGDLAPLPGLPYDWSFAAAPQIRVAPRLAATQSDDAAPVPMPIADTTPPTNVYTNCLQVSRIDSGGNFVMGGCQNETMTVEGNFVSLRTTKAATPGYGYDPVADPDINNFTPDSLILPNDTLKYTLTVEVTERSSIDLVNPVIRDTLPPELVFVRNGTALLDGGAVIQPTFNQSGQQLTWTWDAANPLTVPAEEYGSHYLTVEFYGYVKPGTAPANYTNTMYTVTDSGDVNCEAGSTLADAADVDADGNTTENACENTNTFKVERSAALRGEKWIRSISADNAKVALSTTASLPEENFTTDIPAGTCPDGGNVGLSASTNHFTRYPCISQAYPEGALSPSDYAPLPTDTEIDDFEYNLRIFNEGNVPMLEYTLYDILPYSGDKGSGGTLVNESRQSQFRPTLTGPVTFISGPAPLNSGDFLIEYSASINPCRPEVFDKDPALYPNTPAGCTNDWTNVAPADWSTVRAYRIELISGSIAAAVAPGQELRFGVPMHIPADMPTLGVVDNDDAQSKEIAWNSYSHVGAYDKDEGAPVIIQDLLASEPRKVGITVPERFSIGNRVWRDSDNSGTINAPDDTNPGIENVLVNLYADADGNGVPDGALIASTLTDSGGYYLFSNLPAGKYVIGIPASNFDVVGDPLYGLHSSTGAGATPPADYTNPPDLTADKEDHGIDSVAAPAPSGEVFSASIELSPNGELTNEADLSSNDRDGIAGARRGVNGERNENSDLTVDFGFFGGSDVPFSIGNFVWKDDGANGGVINNGIFEDGKESGAADVLVNLYRDGNGNGVPEAAELIRTDTTDTNGFYLFDNLDPGKYYVQIDKTNFASGGALAGWYSSVPTGTELTYVTGNELVLLHTPSTDSDDNGIDKPKPEVDGVTSGMVELERGVNEATGEYHPSANPADGPLFIGNYGETDETSNITIDFGFIPPMSLGNRVWIDEGAGTTPFRAGYNNGIMDGTELGKAGVTVELWLDDGDGVFNSATDTPMYTDLTDANGYYLFERLQSGEDYFVRIPNTNFDASGDPLYRYISSYDGMQTTAPADDDEDMDDNGIDAPTPATNGVVSSLIHMEYDTESTAETDLGGDGLGTLGQEDNDSNLTVDFGFVQPPRSVGNYLWFDVDNDRTRDVTELPVANALVRLYLDANGNGVPDDVNGDSVLDANDSIAYDETDAGGFYLFDNLLPNRYLVAVDSDNFNAAGTYNALVDYASSTGRSTGNNQDNGFDRILPGDAAASPYGILSGVVDLRVATASPTTDESIISADTGSAAGFNPTEDDGANSRGRYGEANNASDLRIDFGFFKPMSIGNRVWFDDGGTTGTLNNGVMDGDEAPVPNVQVELWRETNSTPGLQTTGATPDLRALYDGVNPYTDLTDSNGYYLFDNLPAGDYYVYLPASNFTGSGKLVGWYSSEPTNGDDDVDVNDNGVNDVHPDINGIASEMIHLALNSEPLTESQLSGATANPGAPTNDDFSPTTWDGPESRGRWNESDVNSNLTVDFGFIPPLSIGNRVWLDNGDTLAGLDVTQFNNGVMDGAEVGIAGVAVSLYFDADNDGAITAAVVNGVAETTPYRTDITDADGFYLFDGLPLGRYFVEIDAANFGAGNPLEGLVTSTDVFDDETGDLNDNGVDDSAYLANGIRSREFILNYAGEPSGETDLSGDTSSTAGFNPTAGDGPASIGRFGEVDNSSNLTADFGFMSPRSLGNRIWLDDGGASGTPNNGVMDGDEAGISGVAVSLYLDNNGDGVPDSATPLLTDTTDANGYYLFSNFPAGKYVVGVDASNFTTVLQYMASSVESATPLDSDIDQNDHGIDSILPASTTYGILSPSIDLTNPPSEPTGETDLSLNPADGTDSRGTHNEADNESDLTVDFGFYRPMSLGNRVWKDNGAGAHYDNGVMDADETPVPSVRVELYMDDDGTPGLDVTSDTMLRYDVTDLNGYYLFDGLIPGEYYVHIPAVNFTSGNPLFGMNGSAPTFADDVDVNDNGVNDLRPDQNGISSGAIVLELDNEPTGETQLSGEADPGAPLNAANDRTGWDGPASRGRFNEPDNSSNLTVDFGFLPVYSLGNRVWFDTGNATGTANNGILDGDELGVNGATVYLYLDANKDDQPDDVNIIGDFTDDFIASTLTDASGYYRFDNLSVGTYIVGVTSPGADYGSAVDANQDADDNVDNNDDGVIVLPTGEVRSKGIDLGDAPEPTGEEPAALNPDSADGEAPDDQSNRTVDFGFVASVAIGNVIWYDTGAGYNNGVYESADELPVVGVTVELYNATTGLKVITGPDGIPNSGDESAGEVVTDAGGHYAFDQLIPGDYYVLIPAFEFQAGGALETYTSATDSVPATTDQTIDNDADENGIDATTANLQANGIRTQTYTLTPGSMPTGEDETSYGGALPDNSVNFTADFGFTQVVAIGNRVWFDVGTGGGLPNNGTQDGGELGAPDVSVELYAAGQTPGVDTPVASTVTDASGNYQFDGLKPGDYFVYIPATEFQTGGDLFGYSSTVGQGANETSDQDADENGSDAQPAINGVSSQVYTLSIDGETEADDETSYTGVLDDNDVNFTADFGFTALVAIGNYVWLDTGAGYNNGIFESADESGIPGVTVNLYYDANNDGNFTGGELTPYSATLTNASGYYQFDRLLPGNYYVGIPNTEFIGTETLVGYTSSTGSGADETSDSAIDENGQDTTTLTLVGIHTIPYTLTPGAMPTDDDETSYTGNLDDHNVNFTADFAFVEAYTLGNRVWFDQDKNGLQNGAEPGMSGVTVNLYQDGNPVIYMTTTTDADGYYRFDSLPAGDYIVEVVPPVGYASTSDAGDPDVDADDNDDNGVNFVGSNVQSDVVTLGTGDSEPTGENNPALNPQTDGESPDARSNRTVDFGFILSEVSSQKQLTATTIMDTDAGGALVPGADFTVTPRVAIGEILTYTATLSVPSAATLTNLAAFDQLDAGLAFVDCVSISAPDLTTTGSFANACANPTVAPQSIPDGYTDATQITFDLGDVSNSTAATQPLVITYRAIVLDIPANVNGVSGLNNSAQWTWGGGSAAPVEATPVQVVEPDLSINKNASPRIADYGSRINFTIDIAHTAQSATDAFDVVATDQIPAGLTLDPATITVTGTASTPGNFTTNFDAPTNTLTVTWASFPLGTSARVRFAAVFVGPAPVTNNANVAWTSLPVDPQPVGTPERLSTYNDYSTERWYDPLDASGVNTYLRQDSVKLNLPAAEDASGLPNTGFAPNVLTPLPLMPADFAYAQTTLKLEIPKLKMNIPIVGVPYSSKDRNWNITWLDRNAGWLEKTAFPTHNGNSVLTAHSILANGLEGPFAKLSALKYGDQIIINLDGQKYIYEVRETKRVRPWEVNAALKHEETAWLTLIGCQDYDETMKEYRYRYLVRAVLVKVE